MKRSLNLNDEYGQLGIIESVSLRNFMCHDNLSFDFDPHMNFIIGRNGSGKSAVITGIILALGGKSSSTGRYSNIKSFIKTGKSSGSVSVTLKNCGADAYKPEDFGQRITVERNFTSEGTSSYKLKSQAGRIISTSKEELTNILNFMDIQIDNPITVLNQDTSKNFLVSKTSKSDKLFHLFFRGTGLAKVREDYMKSLQHSEEMKREIEHKKAILPEIAKDLKKIKASLDRTNKVTELKKELGWAMVVEFEKRRDETIEALERSKKTASTLEAKLRACEADLATVQQTLATFVADRKASSDTMNSLRDDLKELNQKRSTLKSEIQHIQGTCASHERQLKKALSDIEHVENIFNEIKMKNQNDLNEEKLRHELTVNNMKLQIQSMESQKEMMEQEKSSLREVAANIQNKRDTLHTEIQEINYSKRKVAEQKQQLKDGMVKKINVFGPEMENVLQDIKRAVQSRQFKVEPKGPIGMHINVKDPEWIFAVEECLKSHFLKSFICENSADTNCLIKILDKYYQHHRPSIITTDFVREVYDVSANKTICDHPTLLDMLDVDDPVVTNCLIDQKEIENILLVADEKEASQMMLYNPPKNCRFAYTPNGDQYCHSPYRNYSCRYRNKVLVLRNINQEDIRKKEEELKELDALLSAKGYEESKIIQQLDQNGRERRRIDEEYRELKIKLKHVYDKLAEEMTTFEEPKDINCVQSDLESLQHTQQFLEQQYSSSKAALTANTDELQVLEIKIGDVTRLLQSESRKYHRLNEEAGDCDTKQERTETLIKKYKIQLQQIEPIIEKQQNELENNEETLLISITNAEKTGDRIDTGRSPDTIRQILSETEKFMQQQRNCDRDALFKEYVEKQKNFNKSQADLLKLQKTNDRIDSMLKKRLEAFKKICQNTSASLTCCFTYLLDANNFKGYPVIKFEEETLEIYAKPKKSESKSFANLSQLSGGERSYVTIAFLLSLWDRINMPFRILDEYDVFMDSSNRHLSINTLVNTAKANKKIQYIFLSPLELPVIDDYEEVKVHKMPAPKR